MHLEYHSLWHISLLWGPLFLTRVQMKKVREQAGKINEERWCNKEEITKSRWKKWMTLKWFRIYWMLLWNESGRREWGRPEADGKKDGCGNLNIGFCKAEGRRGKTSNIPLPMLQEEVWWVEESLGARNCSFSRNLYVLCVFPRLLFLQQRENLFTLGLVCVRDRVVIDASTSSSFSRSGLCKSRYEVT